MMTLNRLQIEHFMRVKQADITFPSTGVVCVIGQNHDRKGLASSNAAGKSTLAEAISFALYGRAIRGVKKGTLCPFKSTGMKPGHVMLSFDKDGRSFDIDRWLDKSTAKIAINKKLIKLDSNAVGNHIDLDYQTFVNVHILARQESLVFEQKSTRISLFERFTGLDSMMKDLKSSSSSLVKAMAADVDRLSGRLESLQEEFKELQLTLAKHKQSGDITNLRCSNKLYTEINKRLISIEHRLLTESTEALRVLRKRVRQLFENMTTDDSKVRELNHDSQVIAQNLQALEKSLRVARKGTCAACGSKLPRNVVTTEIQRISSLLEIERKKSANVSSSMVKYNRLLFIRKQKYVRQRNRLEKLEASISSVASTFASVQDYITKLNELTTNRISAIEAVDDVLKQSRDTLMQDIDSTKRDLVIAGKRQHIVDTGHKLVSGNLRKLILRSYLNNFNQDLKATMSLFAGFDAEFTDDFDILIDGEPFAAASTGEQMRLVVAVYMNLFRYTAANRDRFNFLVFDDFDLGVDDAGREALAEVLELLGEKMLVLIMSQSTTFEDRFDKQIVAIREKGICRYECNFT